MPKLFGRADPIIAKQTLRIFIDEILKDKKSLVVYVTLIPLNRLLYIVIIPLIFSFIVQSLITQPHNWKEPVMLIGIAVVVSVIALISSFIGFNRLFVSEDISSTRLMMKAMKKMTTHSDQFFSNNKVGALAGDISLFSRSIVAFLDIIFLSMSGIIVNFVVSLIIIGVMSPILLIPLTIITLFLIIHSIHSISKRGALRTERKDRMSQLTGTIADILGNHQIVRYFAGGKSELRRIKGERTEIERIARHEISIIQVEAFVRQAVLFSFQIATIGIAIYLFTNNQVTIAALIFTVTYMGRLTGSLFEIGSTVRNMEQAFLDASKITVLLNTPTEVVDKRGAIALKVDKGAIAFNHVNFSYSDSKGQQVIDDLSLSIEAGQRIGLVGHSGGGKTTLSKLILRFADIDSGSITIDNQDIQTVTQHSLRSNIAYVPQEASLFHRSLRDNVSYGKSNVSDEDVRKALQQANATEFTDKLAKGLDTIVGERGVKLSGGQRQRIAIARAILKDAPILLLDEATSALDSESEILIQSALQELMKGRTSIVIAHRLSTISKLDRIIVLDNGHIIEDGSHEALLTKKGTYARLWAHQSGGFIDE